MDSFLHFEDLYDINQELTSSDRAPIMVLGILKNGSVCDYFKLIGDSIPEGMLFCLSDDFRNQYITFDRDPSSTTFGSETYYGQDFLLKTKNAKLFVFNVLLPFPNKHDKEAFKIEKSKITNYRNIGTCVRLIEEFECDLHSNSIVPVTLAQKYAAISLKPGGKILDILSQNILNSKGM